MTNSDSVMQQQYAETQHQQVAIKSRFSDEGNDSSRRNIPKIRKSEQQLFNDETHEETGMKSLLKTSQQTTVMHKPEEMNMTAFVKFNDQVTGIREQKPSAQRQSLRANIGD